MHSKINWGVIPKRAMPTNKVTNFIDFKIIKLQPLWNRPSLYDNDLNDEKICGQRLSTKQSNKNMELPKIIFLIG